jgi:hypothetical protein
MRCDGASRTKRGKEDEVVGMLIFVHDVISLLILHISRGQSLRLSTLRSRNEHFATPALAPRQARCYSPVVVISDLFRISQEDHAIANWYLNHHHTDKEKGKSTANLLGALASTASGIVGDRASGTNGLVALADIAADVVVTTTDLTVDGSLVLGAADALEVGGLGLLAGGRVDVAALREGDLAVVAGALAADLYFGAGELLLDGLVDAGLEGWTRVVSVCLSTWFEMKETYWSQRHQRGHGRCHRHGGTA